jgi:hypothetical protein
MEYKGQVRGGVVVFDQATPPEGAVVRVEIMAPPKSPSIWEKLQKFSGSIEGPADLAENHDHYIHGGPRK